MYYCICTVFLCCFVYVYFIFICFVCTGVPSENSIAVNNNNNNNNNKQLMKEVLPRLVPEFHSNDLSKSYFLLINSK